MTVQFVLLRDDFTTAETVLVSNTFRLIGYSFGGLAAASEVAATKVANRPTRFRSNSASSKQEQRGAFLQARRSVFKLYHFDAASGSLAAPGWGSLAYHD